MKKKSILIKILNKFFRLSKFQQGFVLYLVILTLLFLFFPVVKVIPLDEDMKRKYIFLLSSNFFQTSFIIFLSLIFLILRNMSLNFKNIVINLFNLKDNEYIISFLFLRIIATGYAGIGDTLSFVNKYTSTLKTTKIYYFTEIFLITGLVIIIYQLIKNIKKDKNRASIVNLMDSDKPEIKNENKKIKSLFD